MMRSPWGGVPDDAQAYRGGTGDVLKSTYNGGPIVAASPPSAGASETWTFVTP
jgi:hypothetical protein